MMQYLGNSYLFGEAPDEGQTLAAISPDLWYESVGDTMFAANTGSTLATPNGTVGAWANLLPGAARITQPTVANRPLLIEADQGGHDAVLFDGVNDILSAASVGAGGKVSVTIIAVMRMVTAPASEDVVMGVGVTGSFGGCRLVYRSSASTNMRWSQYGRDGPISTLSYDPGGSYHIFGGWNTALDGPNNANLMRDGVVQTGSTSSFSINTVDGFSIGSLQGAAASGFHSNIAVGGVGVFYRALSAADRQFAEGYFAWRFPLWGLVARLPSDHPYKSAAP